MKNRRIAQILSIFAFVTGLFLRNALGIIVSILAASLALFYFVKSLRVSKRVTGIRVPSEDHFVSYTCALVFGFSNFISKLLIPFFISSDDVIMSAGILLTSAIITYMAFRIVWIRSGHRDRFQQQPATQKELEKGDTLERTANGIVVLSVLSGLDGADLMLLISLVVFFLSEIYGLINTISENTLKVLGFFQEVIVKHRIDLHKIIHHLAQDLKKIGTKDFDTMFWNRAFHLMQYKKGLAFLVFSFTGSLPLVFFSWAIDFFNFKPEYLVGLFLLTVPSVASFALVRIPVKIASHQREKWRRRLLALSLVLSILGILVVIFYPNIVPLIGHATGTGEQNRLRVGAATLLSLFPVFLGLPIFFGISRSEVNDISGFVKWLKIAGFAPFPLMIVLDFVSFFYSSVDTTLFLFFLYISFLVGAFFYIFMSYVAWSALHDFRARYRLDISQLILRLFNPGPNLITLVSSSTIGTSIFVILQMPPFFYWGTQEILIGSLAFSFMIGLILQYPSYKGIKASIWIAIFATVSYLIAFSLFFLSLSTDYFFQILDLMSYKTIVIPLAMIIAGSILSGIVVKYSPKKPW